MKLLEYEAKGLLSLAGIATPRSSLIHPNDSPELTFPVVLKSQVPTGGRGKAGGIKVVENKDDLQKIISGLFSLNIKGFKPKTILAEEKLSIKHEFYLSLTIDRASATIQLIANSNGGVEVEDNSADTYLQLVVGRSYMVDGSKTEEWDVIGQKLADYYNLPGQTFVLQDLVENLYKCFTSNDATLLEINPLVFTHDNKFVAGDCKMTLDNSAAFRHDWKFEEKPAETNFVTLDKAGNVATIANGAGLAMATVDAVADAGLTPANFLDIGGGANTNSLLAAFNRIVEYPGIKAIVINIFAGITRCDEVARAIIEAKKQINNLPPLFIRLAGTNFNEAAALLAAENIPTLSSLEDCLLAAKNEVSP